MMFGILVFVLSCVLVSPEVLLDESFEVPVVAGSAAVCSYCQPSLPGWINRAHPSYVKVIREDNSFTTPNGHQVLSVFGYRRGPGGAHHGAETTAASLNATLTAGTRYRLTCNVATVKSYGDFVVELSVVDASGARTVLATDSGFVYTSNFTESSEIVYRADAFDPIGQRLVVRLLDADQGDWRNTPMFDNVTLIAEPRDPLCASCPEPIAQWAALDPGAGMRMFRHCGEAPNAVWVEGRSAGGSFKGVWDSICADPLNHSLSLSFYPPGWEHCMDNQNCSVCGSNFLSQNACVRMLTLPVDPATVSSGCSAPINDTSPPGFPRVVIDESFEVPDVVDSLEVCSYCWPPLEGWKNPSHPSYVKVTDVAGKSFSTPYGNQVLTVFGYQRGPNGAHSGAESQTSETLQADRLYKLTFNVAAGGSYGDYVVELCAVDADGFKTTLASTNGVVYSKNMSESGGLVYQTDSASPLGQRLMVRLLDADVGAYQNTPAFDNIKLIVDIVTRECVQLPRHVVERIKALRCGTVSN